MSAIKMFKLEVKITNSKEGSSFLLLFNLLLLMNNLLFFSFFFSIYLIIEAYKKIFNKVVPPKFEITIIILSAISCILLILTEMIKAYKYISN